MDSSVAPGASKVPEVTFGFWILKILATTLGETGGDAVTMSMDLGYAIGSLIFIGLFALAVTAQIRVRSLHPFLYWAVILATTTAGTAMADFGDRSLGIGYLGGSLAMAALLAIVLGAWFRTTGSIAVDHVVTPREEIFYWTAILFSQTLGTALGDWLADTNGLGFGGGALVFGAGLVVVALCYFFTNLSRTLLFWSAFVLTRPLGATLGDLLDKPLDEGGLNFNRFTASLLLAAAIVALIAALPKRSASQGPASQGE
jgi:uncharacterized membrane-anchored protein